MIFSKGEQTIVSFLQLFQEPKEKLENIKVTIHFNSYDFCSQTHLIIVPENWQSDFKLVE